MSTTEPDSMSQTSPKQFTVQSKHLFLLCSNMQLQDKIKGQGRHFSKRLFCCLTVLDERLTEHVSTGIE